MTADLRLVVFDLDGTLVDSQHVIVAAMRTAFTAADLDPPSAAQIRRIVGLSLDRAVAALAPGLSAVAVDELCARYKQVFTDQRASPDHDEPMFDGAQAAIRQLNDAGHLLGVATGKSRRGLVRTLDRFGMRDLFLTLQSSDDAPSKPHPAMLRHAMAEVGASPVETVMIGDTTFDMEMARAAGAGALGVAWGNHEVGELRTSGADAIVDTFDDLCPKVAELFSSRRAQ